MSGTASEYTVIYQSGKMVHIWADNFRVSKGDVYFVKEGENIAYFNTANIVGFVKACRDELQQGDD